MVTDHGVGASMGVTGPKVPTPGPQDQTRKYGKNKRLRSHNE